MIRSLAVKAFNNHEPIAHLCGGFNSITLAAAVVVGGLFTLTLLEPENARADLANKQAHLTDQQLSTAKLGDELRRAIGQVTLSANVVRNLGPTECYTQVHATVANTGNREIILEFRNKAPLHVATVTIDTGGSYHYEPLLEVPVHGYNDRMDAVTDLPRSHLVPGESSSYPFLLRLSRKQVYLVEFAVPVQVVPSQLITGDTQRKNGWFWSARRFMLGCASDEKPTEIEQRVLNGR